MDNEAPLFDQVVQFILSKVQQGHEPLTPGECMNLGAVCEAMWRAPEDGALTPSSIAGFSGAIDGEHFTGIVLIGE